MLRRTPRILGFSGRLMRGPPRAAPRRPPGGARRAACARGPRNAIASGSCVTSSPGIARSRQRSRSNARISLVRLESRLPVGSSASSSPGSPTSARTIVTRWRSPIESCSGQVLGALAQADALQPRPGPRARLAQREAEHGQLDQRVVERARAGHQVKLLRDEADLAAAIDARSRAAERRAMSRPRRGCSRDPAPAAQRRASAASSCPSRWGRTAPRARPARSAA